MTAKTATELLGAFTGALALVFMGAYLLGYV